MTNNIIKNIETQLRDKFSVKTDVELCKGLVAKFVATRTYFSWKGLVIISQHIILLEKENARITDLQHLFNEGFHYGKKTNKIPLLRGMQFGYIIIPIIVTTVPSEKLIKYVESQPPKRWSLFEFPVVVDTSFNKTYFFKKTPAWGAFFFSDMRKTVTQYIVKKTNEKA